MPSGVVPGATGNIANACGLAEGAAASPVEAVSGSPHTAALVFWGRRRM